MKKPTIEFDVHYKIPLSSIIDADRYWVVLVLNTHSFL